MREFDGSCPICKIGEIEDYKCTYCKTEFCRKCFGVLKTFIGLPQNVLPCSCPKKVCG